MSYYLPEPLWIDILLRLPVDTLLRCTSVCISWYTLITSSSFISQHIHRTANTTTTPLLLVREYYNSEEYKKEHYSLRFDNTNTFDVYKTLDFPFKGRNWCFRVIGSSNGLVCLSDREMSYSHLMILWNPSIRKHLTLPWPGVTYLSHGPFVHSIGFGFNAATNDYKVVRVVHLEDPVGYRGKIPPEVEIYELSTGSWRSVDPMGFPYAVYERTPQAFLNGVVHWVGYNPNNVGGSFFKLIVSFDIGKEEFGVIMLPDSVADRRFPRCCVAVVGELLSLMQYTLNGDGDKCCVWVMKQYGVHKSWTKHSVIHFKQGLQGAALRSNSFEEFTNLILNIFKRKQVNEHRIFDICGVRGSYFVNNFVETLVLLDRVNGELRGQRNFGVPTLLKEDGVKGNQRDEGKTKEEEEEQEVTE